MKTCHTVAFTAGPPPAASNAAAAAAAERAGNVSKASKTRKQQMHGRKAPAQVRKVFTSRERREMLETETECLHFM